MLRLPLVKSDTHENGRLQPYVAAGPTFVLSVLTSDLADGADAGFDVGFDLRAGVAIMLSRHFGLFTEYGYSDIGVSIENSAGDKVKSTIKTNRVHAGVALRF